MRAAGLRNGLKCLLLVAAIAAPAGAIGWLLADRPGATLFALCALMGAVGAWWLGDRALLGTLGARPYALAEDPMLRSTTDRLAAQLGVPAPRLALIADGFPRACLVGRGAESTTLVVSTGLLSALPGPELEAVIAHELAHAKSLDVLSQTWTVLFSSTLVEVTRIGGWFSRTLLYVLAPVGAAATHAMLSPKREFAADALAASVVGWEHMADALLRLDKAGDLVQFSAIVTSEPLWTVSPFDVSHGLARMFSTHPPVEKRVERLRKLSVAA
ncbi:MAG: M48 family metalloprotease [Gaiella sp.]